MAGDESDDEHNDPLRAVIRSGLAPTNPSLQPIVENFGRHGWVDAEEFESWLTPAETLQALVFHFDQQIVVEALLRRLGLGLVGAAAEVTTLSSDEGNQQEAHGFVPPIFWTLSSTARWQDPFWKTGDLWFSTSPGSSFTSKDWIEFTGVRFDPAGIAKAARALGKSIAPPVSESPKEKVFIPQPGGRPPKPFWDDLWAEICAQIYSGDLTPDKQAKVEKAMLDWAAARPESLSEPSARLAARKLMQAIARKDKN